MTTSATLKGLVCLITGASRGIGRAIARAVSGAGAAVAVNYHQSEQAALTLEDELIAGGAQAMAIKADVSNGRLVEDMFLRVEDRLGPVDLLVNNAGIAFKGLLTDTRDEDWARLMAVNLTGPFLCSRRALPAMISKRFGRIVNIASMQGVCGASCEAAYAASKGGLIALSKSLASEVGPSGITVNAIAPGPVLTDMLCRDMDEGEMGDLLSLLPVGRWGQPEDIARACLFLLSPQNSFVNGSVLALDGGWKA
ncbi:MAG TPA: 3-oxoacyl-ACP reductase [Syntrophomonas sp.]|nr:3-oxoacyl-ACP reductase [Syntrophomonas sp.]